MSPYPSGNNARKPQRDVSIIFLKDTCQKTFLHCKITFTVSRLRKGA